MYPTTLPSYDPFTTPITLADMDHTDRHKAMERDIAALALKVGINSSADTSSVDYKLTTVIGNVATLSTTVTGITTRINNIESGAEAMSAPAISSFANSAHNHTNAAGGGKLTGSSAITDGTITPASLLAGAPSTWVWQAGTPTWNNLTLGNGSTGIRYAQIGKLMVFRAWLNIGSTTVISGTISFSLPGSPGPGGSPFGWSWTYAVDISASVSYVGHFPIISFSNCTPSLDVVNGTYANPGAITGSAPTVWAASDIIEVTGFFELA